jgi:hypothetical protein
MVWRPAAASIAATPRPTCTCSGTAILARAGSTHGPPIFDDRLFPSLLTPSEHAKWQTDVNAANEAARAAWERAWAAGERPPAPGPYVQRYRMRFTRDAAGPVRVEGTMDVPHIGTARVRGERVSDDVLACGSRRSGC